MSRTPPSLPSSFSDTIEAAQSISPLGVENVPLAEALGRVLRSDLFATADQPPFSRSAVDGYAVRTDDLSPEFHIVDQLRAGDWRPRQLATGETVRIATGAAVPCEGLQVVMVEDCRIEGERVRFVRRDTSPNIRYTGEDMRSGQTLLRAPQRLTPGALALLASQGHTVVPVTRIPRVLHLATGNEIVPPDIVPACGQIRDSNSTLVSAFCGARGIRPRQQRVAEDYDHALAAVRQAAGGGEWPDLMLISGGASVGEHDFTRRLFENLGYEIIIARTSSRPGKPLIVARREASLAFGLPGNPLAHYVGLHVFVQAALDRFAGLPAAPPLLEGILSEAIDNGVDGRETFWPARHFQTGSQCHLQPLRWISSGDVSSMGLASALIRLPAGTSRLAAGSRVAFVSTIATT